MKEFNSVALLPMKAHSERVQGKNFRHLCGKPLYRWMLDTLLSIPEIDLVVINTDARELLAKDGLDRLERVLVRDRKSEICGDFVSMNLVLEDDIDNVPSKTYLMTHTTNPLLKAESIRRAIEQYNMGIAQGCDSLFSVDKIQTRFYRADGSAINHDPGQLLRTQDLEPMFAENSGLYIFSRQSFKGNGGRIGKKPILFEVPKTESVDIDTQTDWIIAEALAMHPEFAKTN